MAERGFANCEKCGCEINKRSSLDWAYNEHSHGYICGACCKKLESHRQIMSSYALYLMKCGSSPFPPERQARSNKISGTIITVISSITLLLSLFALFSTEPASGIVFGILAVVMLILGIRSIKKANEMEDLIEAKANSKL